MTSEPWQTIEYEERIEFGTMRRRIVNNSDAVAAFRNLTNRITLTDEDVRNLPRLGCRLVCTNGRIPNVS